MSRNLSVIVLGNRDERVLETLESMEGDLRFKVKVYGYDSELPALDLDLEKGAGGLDEALKECETRYITFLKPGDIVDNLYIPGDDEERPIILGTLDGEYETGSTHSLASLLFETKTLPRDLRGIMFNLEKIKIIGDQNNNYNSCNSSNYEVGRICIHLPMPPGFMKGLYGNEKIFISKYFTSDLEYYITGDIGYINNEGFLCVLGREDDVIKVAGHRLSTGRIEEVLNEVEGVIECAVVGMKDKIKGEVPVAFIVGELLLLRSR